MNRLILNTDVFSELTHTARHPIIKYTNKNTRSGIG